MNKAEVHELVMKVIEQDSKRIGYAICASRMKIFNYENALKGVLEVLDDKTVPERSRKKLIRDIVKTALKGDKI